MFRLRQLRLVSRIRSLRLSFLSNSSFSFILSTWLSYYRLSSWLKCFTILKYIRKILYSPITTMLKNMINNEKSNISLKFGNIGALHDSLPNIPLIIYNIAISYTSICLSAVSIKQMASSRYLKSVWLNLSDDGAASYGRIGMLLAASKKK